MQSIEHQIEMVSKQKPLGTPLFPDNFANLGSPEAIRKALQRLQDKGILTRVAQGIYTRPKETKYAGRVLPTAEDIAEAIARRDKARTVPTGAYALNALGLSTQIPMKIVILTDGSPREIKLGNRTIKFKKTTPKNLLPRGKISRLAIQALKEIGNGNLAQEEEHRIVELLKKESLKDLEHDIRLAPVWIQKIMKKALKWPK
jgi:hypothetical protein